MFAPLSSCPRHAYDDETCKKNNCEFNGTVIYEDLKKWDDVTEHYMLYLYGTDYSKFLLFLDDMSAEVPNARIFETLDLEYVYMQGESCNASLPFFALSTYLRSKIWNIGGLSDTDVDNLISDFCNHYYKEAGADIKGLYDYIKSYYAGLSYAAGCPSYYVDYYFSTAQYSKDFIKNCYNNYLISALTTMNTQYGEDSVEYKRVLELELYVRYLFLYLYESDYSTLWGGFYYLNAPYYTRNYSNDLATFKQQCADLGIIYESEAAYSSGTTL